MVDQLSL